MSHPYRDAAHKNDPSWLRGVEKYTEKARSDDLDATVRNYAVDKSITSKAAYEPLQKKGK